MAITNDKQLQYGKWDLIQQMERDPDAVAASLGGTPFAIVCPVGQLRRWRRMADYLGLHLFESEKVGVTTRDDSMVLIHAGEVATWLPNLRMNG